MEKAPIHYKVKVKLVRFIQDGKIDFIDEEKEFFNEVPIKAREEAFSFYQNYVDVLLESQGVSGVPFRQAIEVIRPFLFVGFSEENLMYRIGQIEELGLDSPEFNRIHEDTLLFSSIGLNVFMVVDRPLGTADVQLKDWQDREFMIHHLGNDIDPQLIMDSLNMEFEYYTIYGLDTNGQETTIRYVERDDDFTEPDDNLILETPFDWTGLDKLSDDEWARIEVHSEDSKDHEEEKGSLSLEDLIRGGENEQVEFKPSLVYNFNTGAGSIGVKAIIAKAICGLVNSKGGILFIGLKDDGAIQGLDPDFSLSDKPNKEDWFLLEFDQMISHFFSHSVINNLKGVFVEIDGVKIFACGVFPSKSGPFFIKGRSGEPEFYVRGLASTQQLRSQSDIDRYCKERWGLDG
ncbi:MAG: ATP-binding protein [Bacteroidota bacterium]|nr:ATP-binding protein [Bacteroidota bacterium]